MDNRLDFIIAGTQKGGTTALFRYLRAHPRIQMPRVKEVHFFDRDEHFREGNPDYGRLHAHFDFAIPGITRGEATPVYMYWQDSPARIWAYNPDIRLVVVLRNPIERARSQWQMETERGRESVSFSEAIRGEQERCRQALPAQHRVFSYVDRGFYCEQLRRLWRFFPRDHVLVLRHEDLVDDPRGVVARTCAFIGAGDATVSMGDTVSIRDYRGKISAEDWCYLRDTYEFEIRELERLLEWNCSAWLERD